MMGSGRAVPAAGNWTSTLGDEMAIDNILWRRPGVRLIPTMAEAGSARRG
jgi:hypothetical protein